MKLMWLLFILLLILSFALSLKVAHPYSIDDEEIGKTLAGEAIGEGYIGMYAVACVIQNRCMSINRAKEAHLRPRDIIAHGFFGGNTEMASRGFYAQKTAILKLVNTLNELKLKDITGGATHFENVEAFGWPWWSKNMIVTCKIGRHTFFKERR